MKRDNVFAKVLKESTSEISFAPFEILREFREAILELSNGDSRCSILIEPCNFDNKTSENLGVKYNVKLKTHSGDSYLLFDVRIPSKGFPVHINKPNFGMPLMQGSAEQLTETLKKFLSDDDPLSFYIRSLLIER